MIKLKYYQDPGHGWVAVQKSLLQDLGISDKITRFSYMKGDLAYLEEDCDLPALTTALALKGQVVSYQYHCTNSRSRIRNYSQYSI